ncbi:MAG TPA: protein kinase [Gemmataceae bacterium]|nr:protein kinase [Gemmataceae bacterium]
MDQEVAVLSRLPKWACEPGAQPIPGYRLIEPLGRGGFGEVWKCEAPGGLFKAVKFVPNQDDLGGPANQEREALQRVKTIRHPFILSLDRVEVVEGVLVIVMELADKSLYSLLGDYQGENLLGIPREELLGYLLEAAEALDWMNFRHGLQHLDIKPHNLFVVSNHLKVADFGLVDQLSDVEKSHPAQRQGGITPLYAAPELLRGTVSRHCDQYSLAIVYQQLLTGTVPFWHQNMYQLMLLHLTAEPNLGALSTEDGLVIARALSKRPEDRFPSCLDFLQALVCGQGETTSDLPRRTSAVKKMVSALRAAEKAAKPIPQSLVDTTKTPAEEQGSAGGAFATVPTKLDDDAQTSPGGVLPRLPRPSLLAKAATAVVPRRGPSTPAPTCVSLPGYRFLQCTSQTLLGDIWTVEDEQGRSRRALCLHNFVDQDPALIERLESLSHPALPPTQVAWSPTGRLVLVTDEFEQTLRDRLESCQKQGLPGIPREQLLGYLRTVAEALDCLYQQHELPHLGLNPRTLTLRAEAIWVMDFGLVPLLWLPTGQTGASLNGRYAAPELYEKLDLSGIPSGETARAALMGRAGSASDQFSLALIYAEMVNGIPPQMVRASVRSPRRSNVPRHTSRCDSGLISVRGQSRVDLDLLPGCDREILYRALRDDPEQRFASCTALIEALEAAASQSKRREDLYYRLPSVIPFASLEGEPPPPNVVLPPLAQLVRDLATPPLLVHGSPRTILGPLNIRYVVQQNDIWECKCPVQLFTGALALKIAGFQSEWQARIAYEKDNSFVFHIDLPSAARSGNRENALPPRIAFQLDVQSPSGSAKHYAEARMRIRPEAGDREHIARLLPEVAPRLFDSMRLYLQAGPEQRSEDRWQCPQPLRVYPVLPDLELDDILDGMSRNISPGGVSFRVAKAPRTEQAYLHWYKSATVAPFALLARIKRVQSMAGGGYEVGASFQPST